MIKECRGCQLPAEAPPIKTQPWPKTNIPGKCVYIDYAGPLNGYYYFIIINSISKWPEIYKFNHPTSMNTIKALYEIFSYFGVSEILVSNNGTMFMGKEFRDYCSSLAIKHITTPAYNSRSNREAERSVDMSKRTLRKNQELDADERSIQKFLAVYRITPNPNTSSKLSPAELMFA